MTLRTLLVTPSEGPLEGSRWDSVRAMVRAHASCSLIAEVIGDEALAFASLSRPDLLVLAWSASSEALRASLNDAVPGVRLMLVDAPEGMPGATSAAAFGEALARLVDEATRTPADGPRPGKVVVVHAPKGGSGRSQLATNLAIALARGTGRETILLDGAMEYGEQDLFLNLQALGLSEVTTPQRLERALAWHPTGVKLLAGTRSEPALTPERLTLILGWLQQRDAWIVVDTNPAKQSLNRVFLSHAERVFLPMLLDLAHLRALQRELAGCREQGIDSSRFEFVCWGDRSEVSREDAARTLKRSIDWSLPFDPARVRASINQGIPILQAEPRGVLARELARMVASLGESRRTMALVATREQPWTGLLNWIRRGPAPSGFGV